MKKCSQLGSVTGFAKLGQNPSSEMYLIVSSSISNKLSLYDIRKCSSNKNEFVKSSFVTYIPTLTESLT